MFSRQNPQTDSGTLQASRNALSRGKTDRVCSWPPLFGKDERSCMFTASCTFMTVQRWLSYKNGPYFSSDCNTPAFQLFVEYFFRLSSFQSIWRCVPEFVPAVALPCMVRSQNIFFSVLNWDMTCVLKETSSVSVVLLARQLACVAPVSYTVHMARLACLIQLLYVQFERLAFEGGGSHWFLRLASWQ